MPLVDLDQLDQDATVESTRTIPLPMSFKGKGTVSTLVLDQSSQKKTPVITAPVEIDSIDPESVSEDEPKEVQENLDQFKGRRVGGRWIVVPGGNAANVAWIAPGAERNLVQLLRNLGLSTSETEAWTKTLEREVPDLWDALNNDDVEIPEGGLTFSLEPKCPVDFSVRNFKSGERDDGTPIQRRYVGFLRRST